MKKKIGFKLNEIPAKVYLQNIANEWFKVQDKLLANLTPETDIVKLHKPNF